MRCSSNYNLVTEYPNIANEWNYEKNVQSPFDVSPKSGHNVWWKCSFNPNHVWKAKISNRTTKHYRCPKCTSEFKMSYPATVLYYYLKQIFPDCKCEYKIKKYKLDIYIPSLLLAIEYDGIYYHNNGEAKQRELKKDLFLKNQGIHVLRIKESKDLEQGIVTCGNVIYYEFKGLYEKVLGDVVKSTFLYISNLQKKQYSTHIDIKKHSMQIEQLVFHEKKMRTLAYTNKELLSEWSPNNKYTPDLVYTRNNTNYLWICPKCKLEYKATLSNRINANSGCPYCSNYKASMNNCLATLFPDIAASWDYDKNKSITPYDVLPGSQIRVWWKCHTCNQSWNTYVYQRTGKAKSGCPYCAHYLVLKEHSLLFCYPDIIEWIDQKLEKEIDPALIAAHSNKQIHLKCPECGYKFRRMIAQFIKLIPENRCPRCRDTRLKNRKISSIQKYWSEKNGIPLTYRLLLDNKQYIFRCQKKGHEWKTTVEEIYRKKHKCPYCYSNSNGKFLIDEIELMREWDYDKNIGLDPTTIPIGSSKKVSWRCHKNHRWDELIHKRAIRKYGCPYCSGRRVSKEYSFAAKFPNLLKDWDYEKNKINPDKITPYSGVKINWKCSKCGNMWNSSIISRVKSQGCSKCRKRVVYDKLDKVYPHVLIDWDYEKNTRSPSNYSAHSSQRVWWKCHECSHEWYTDIYSRVAKGSGCPNCYRIRNKRTTL